MTATDILPLILEVGSGAKGWDLVCHPAPVDKLLHSHRTPIQTQYWNFVKV